MEKTVKLEKCPCDKIKIDIPFLSAFIKKKKSYLFRVGLQFQMKDVMFFNVLVSEKGYFPLAILIPYDCIKI